jgi:hypothetical protein
MSFLERAAEASNQREALLVLAGALDVIDQRIADLIEQLAESAPEDKWEGGWEPTAIQGIAPHSDEPEEYGAGAAAREPAQPLERDGADWVIPPAPLELQQRRRKWAEQYLIGIGAGTGDELAAANTGTNVEELVDAYTKGGPEWLTAYDTEYVQTLPGNAKQAMALDYEERGRRQEALEFAVAFMQGDATSMANTEPLGDTLPGAPR